MKRKFGYRTTTTRLRRRHRPGIVFVLTFLLLPLAFLAWRAATTDETGDPSSVEACVGLDCAVAVLKAPASSAASGAGRDTASIPCPYCGADPNAWRRYTDVEPPAIGGKAAAVIEGQCGALLFGFNQDLRLPPASLTKMVTAMVVQAQGRLYDRVKIDIDGWSLASQDGSSIMGLERGMNLSVEELLYGMLLPSGNDAALALAQHFGGQERFVALMNEHVRKAGLRNTRFANPDGRDHPNQYSSAFDMALLGRQMMQDPLLRKISSTLSFMPKWDGPVLWNSNYLLQIYPGAFGVKTGYTGAANYTIVGAATWEGRELYVAVMGSWNLYGDTWRLLDWAFEYTQPSCPDS